MSTSSPSRACKTCGKVHPIREMELVYSLPDAIFELSEQDRAQRSKTSTDICMLDESRMFLRAVLPLPVLGRDRPYRIGAWVEVSTEAFRQIHSLWDDPEQVSHSPFAATLANDIYNCPGSIGQTVELRLTGPKTRPDIFLTESDQMLCQQQQNGISEHVAHQYSERIPSQDAV
jgi:hypothetical protein